MPSNNSQLRGAKATATKAAAKTVNARVSTTNAPPNRGTHNISCPPEYLNPLVSAHRERFKSQSTSILIDCATKIDLHRKFLQSVGVLLFDATDSGHPGLADSQVLKLIALVLCEVLDFRNEHVYVRITKGMAGFRLDFADGPTILRLQVWDLLHADCLSRTVFEIREEKGPKATPDDYPWALGLIRSVLESPTQVHLGFSDCQGLLGCSH